MTIYLERGDKGTRGDGSKGDWIVAWQSFLAGEGHYEGDYSPNFGPRTEKATMAWQKAVGLGGDGVVGGNTTREAVKKGFGPSWCEVKGVTLTNPEDAPEGYGDPNWPQPSDLDGDGRADLTYGGYKLSQELFGPLEYSVGAGNKIIVDPEWKKAWITQVLVPQLVGVLCYGKKMSGKVWFHRKAVAQLLGAFQEIEEAGLLHLVLTWGGSYVPRFIRGSTTTISNHTFGSAFDMNHEYNGLGKQPALVGEEGSVRPLLPIFEKWGFFNGTWYRRRKDGMHNECVKLIEPAELSKMVNALGTNDHILPWLKDVA